MCIYETLVKGSLRNRLNVRLWAKGHPGRAGTQVNQSTGLQPNEVPGSQEAPVTNGDQNERGRLGGWLPNL